MNEKHHWNTEQVSKVLHKTGSWYSSINHVCLIQQIFMKPASDHFQFFLSQKIPKLWVCNFWQGSDIQIVKHIILKFCIIQICSTCLCRLQNATLETVKFILLFCLITEVADMLQQYGSRPHIFSWNTFAHYKWQIWQPYKRTDKNRKLHS